MRFTNAVANQGFSVIHSATAPRRSASGEPNGNSADVRKNFGCIRVPGAAGSFEVRHVMLLLAAAVFGVRILDDGRPADRRRRLQSCAASA